MFGHVEAELRKSLGDELFQIITQYYNNAFSQLDNSTRLVFLSRRGYELFKLLEKNKLIDALPINIGYVSDRYIQKLSRKEIEDFFRGFETLVISDDSIVEGNVTEDLLLQIGKDFLPKNVKLAVPMVYEHFYESKISKTTGRKVKLIEPDYFTLKDINRFTLRFVDLANRLGMFFAMDLPMYRCRFPNTESIQNVLQSEFENYNCTDMLPTYAEDNADENTVALGDYTNLLTLLPKNEIFKKGKWLYEGVRCYFPEGYPRDNAKTLELEFISSALFSAIKISGALKFLYEITKKIDPNSSMHNRIKEMCNDYPENIKLNDRNLEDLRSGAYIHRVAVLFLSAAVGKKCFGRKAESEINYMEMARHIPPSVLDVFKKAYAEDSYLQLIQDSFESSGLCAEEFTEKDLIRAYNAGTKKIIKKYKQELEPYDLLKRELDGMFAEISGLTPKNAISAIAESARLVKIKMRRWAIPVFYWLNKLGNLRPDVVLALLVATGSSISSFKGIISFKNDLIIKAGSPGEGVIVSLCKQSKPFVEAAAINYFVNTVGDDYTKSIEEIKEPLELYFKKYVWDDKTDKIRNLNFESRLYQTGNYISDYLKNDEFDLDNKPLTVAVDYYETNRDYKASDDFSCLYSKFSEELRAFTPDTACDVIAVMSGLTPRTDAQEAFTQVYNRVLSDEKKKKPLKYATEFLSELKKNTNLIKGY
ncbi:MAG: hypothetical protein FWF78_08110 [Defluviitaleaceae bacterium]|nr:hypothetical protein [Defluviitaleaceae bacterium]